MTDNLSKYFENTASISVFDSIASAAGTEVQNDVKLAMVGPEGAAQDNINDSIRDLWIHPEESAVTMLTSPGILSNNDLVRPGSLLTPLS